MIATAVDAKTGITAQVEAPCPNPVCHGGQTSCCEGAERMLQCGAPIVEKPKRRKVSEVAYAA